MAITLIRQPKIHGFARLLGLAFQHFQVLQYCSKREIRGHQVCIEMKQTLCRRVLQVL